jgi:hypothetical protein
MNDLQQAYAALAVDADSVGLASADVVRTRSDRRTRTRVALAATSVAVVVGLIVALTAWGLRGNALNMPQPAHTPSPSSTTSPSATAPPSTTPPSSTPPSSTAPPSTATLSPGPVPTGPIPDRAFLQAADTNGDKVSNATSPSLPPFCGAAYPSDSKIMHRRTRWMYYRSTPQMDMVPSGQFDETIATYRPGGAVQYMKDLRRAVRGCSSEKLSGVTYRYRLVTATQRGDDSILIEQRRRALPYVPGDTPPPGDDVFQISVVRIGDAVMLLSEGEYERAIPDPAAVDHTTEVAVSRLLAWLA